jgi:hypothetical protein
MDMFRIDPSSDEIYNISLKYNDLQNKQLQMLIRLLIDTDRIYTLLDELDSKI